MKLKKAAVKDLVPYEKNPRKNDKAVDAVVESIKECGYCNPIIVDEDMVILAGHTRVKALKKLGWKTCDILVAEGFTEEQKKKYRIFDNKTNEFAEWDLWALEQEMAGLDFSAFENIDWGIGQEETTEFVNKEYGESNFADEDFDYECPECGFRFNKK